MNCPGVFIRDVKSIFNQGQIALLPVLELDVNPVTLGLPPCFLPRWRGKEGQSGAPKRYSRSTNGKKKPIQLPPTDEAAAEVQVGPGSSSHHTLFKACEELLPSSAAAKLSLISTGATKRYFSSCTGRGAIDSCRTASTATQGYSTT